MSDVVAKTPARARDKLVERALKRFLPMVQAAPSSEDVSVPADDFAVILGLLKATLPNQASAVESAFDRAIAGAERDFRRNKDRSWVLQILRERIAQEIGAIAISPPAGVGSVVYDEDRRVEVIERDVPVVWRRAADGAIEYALDMDTREIIGARIFLPPAGGGGPVDELDKGIDFALEQLCGFLGVDQAAVCWDAATETLDGDVRSVIGNILRARFGDDWSPASPDAAQQRIAALEEALQAVKAAILSDVNSLAIQCTIFMPGGGAPPHETVVDFIDAALGGGHE